MLRALLCAAICSASFAASSAETTAIYYGEEDVEFKGRVVALRCYYENWWGKYFIDIDPKKRCPLSIKVPG